MAGHANQALGTVFVNRGNNTQKNIPKIIRDCIDGRLNAVLVHDREQWCPPDRTDFYIYLTRLSVTVEHAAARSAGDAELVCLAPLAGPAGAQYLSEQILKRTTAGHDVWIFQHGDDWTTAMNETDARRNSN